MRTRHVIYAGAGLAGLTTSLHVLFRGPRDEGFERLRSGADVALSSGLAHVCIGILFTGSLYYPSFLVAREKGHPVIRERLEHATSLLPVLDGVVLIVDSQDERLEANLFQLEQVIEFLQSEGIDSARIPFVFQLNKRDLPNVMSVDELRRTIATPWCTYVESVAVHRHGVHRALETVLEMSDGRMPAT